MLALNPDELSRIRASVAPDIHSVLGLPGTAVKLNVKVAKVVDEHRPNLPFKRLPITWLGKLDAGQASHISARQIQPWWLHLQL
jgi:hypothetical protein